MRFAFRTRALARHPILLIAGFALGMVHQARCAPAIPLRTTAAVRDLPAELASKRLPVHLEATVTYYGRSEHVLFVHDATGGIFIETDELLPVKPGSLLSVWGVTAADFTNVVTQAHAEEISKGSLPAPRPVDVGELLTGSFDCDYVVTSGVIRSAFIAKFGQNSYLELRLGSVGRAVDVSILDYSGLDADSLIGSEVQVTGPAGGNFNDRQQLVGVLIHAQSWHDLKVLRPPTGKLYTRDVQPLSGILKTRAGSRYGLRTHVQGTVSYYSPGNTLILADGAGSLEVKTRQMDPLSIGDKVDATGYPDFGDYSPVLEDANFRKLPQKSTIQPLVLKASDSLGGALDAKLISLEGVLLGVTGESSRQTLAVSVGKTLVAAILDTLANPKVFRDLRAGSRVRITGICMVESGGLWQPPRGYHILLRSPGDVTVLSTPPWWDGRRLGYLLLSIVAAAFMALIWVVVLRRRVKAQTGHIRRVLEQEAARDKNLAALQEARSRILERMNRREPVTAVLAEIAALIEEQTPCSCCVHLASGRGTLDVIAGTCSSSELQRRQQHLAIAAEGELAARAAFHRTPVSIAAPHFASSWPFFSADGQIAGTVTVYSHAGHGPVSPEVLELATQLAALAMENRRLYDTLVHSSEHDALTGLPNRTYLEKQLAKELIAARDLSEMLAVVYIDLDKFKAVNDVHGHAVGDAYLNAVAGRFRAALRDQDFVSRFGGDEFVALLRNVKSREHALEIAERLTLSLRDPLTGIGPGSMECGASIGIAVFPLDGASPDDLKRHADAGMYEAKAAREKAPAPKSGEAHADCVPEAVLQTALDAGQLRVHYQPIFSIGGALMGFEALARLETTPGELMPPARFIDTAEGCGLIIPLGISVLEQSCRQVARWNALTRQDLAIFVNVSPKQLGEPDFSDQVIRIVRETKISPKCLTLEVTEGCLLSHVEHAAQQLGRLRKVGVRVAMDDFGTGYSTLSRLHSIPLDFIKIDRAFTSDICRDPANQAIVRAVVALANAFHAETIAEGVESEEQLDPLFQLCCSGVQGFGFAKPMAADAVELLLPGWLEPARGAAARLEEAVGQSHGVVLQMVS